MKNIPKLGVVDFPMMPNITRGGDTHGLVKSLVAGPSTHTIERPRFIAGCAMLENLWEGWELIPAFVEDLTKLLDFQMWEPSIGTYEKYDTKTKTWNKVRDKNHVWHCTLTLAPDEEHLPDSVWHRITIDFMNTMGFTETGDSIGWQWCAIHHGPTNNGSDHLHIVANIMREDNVKFDTWQDFRRSQQTCNMLEHKYGLQVLASRNKNALPGVLPCQ